MGFNSTTARQAGSKSSRRGTPNRATTDLRQVVAQLLEDNAEAIVRDLKALEPAARVAAWTKLLEFTLPKLSRQQSEHSGPDGKPIEICSIVFTDDAQDGHALPNTQAPAQAQAPQAAPAEPEPVLIVVPQVDALPAAKEAGREDAEKTIFWR